MSDNSSLLDIIELIYGIEDTNEMAQALFEHLRPILPFESAVFMPVDPETWQMCMGYCQDCSPQHMRQFLDHYYRLDPVIVQGADPFAPNQAIRLSDFVSERELKRSEFFDFTHQVGYDYALAVVTGYRDVPTVCIGLHRPKGQPDFREGEADVLSRISTHVGRAVFLRNLFQRPLQAEDSGIFLVDGEGRVVSRSAHLDRILAALPSQRLLDALTTKTSLSLEVNGKLYRLKRLNEEQGCLLARFFGSGKQPSASAAFAIEPVSQRARIIERLKRMGLTKAEIKVALKVMQGCSNQDIAEQFHLALQTVKDHICHIFQKAGVRNRTELLCKISGLSEDLSGLAELASHKDGLDGKFD